MKYVKPDVYVERFQLNEMVANDACTPESYKAVDVDCLIKSGDVDGVFYDDQTGICNYYATSSNLVTINGITYLYWYGQTSGSPSAGGINPDGSYYGQVLMDALQRAGISNSAGGGQHGSGNSGLHAGIASPEIIAAISAS